MADEDIENTVLQSAALDATLPLVETSAESPRARSVPAPADPYQRGASLGRYVLLDKIGEGAMGAVYTAFDPELDRRIALKVLHPEKRSSAAHTQGRGRLVREAKAMARLNHPNVIQVFDVGTLDDTGDVYVAMEFVTGTTLTDWQVAQERGWQEILAVYRQAGRGLAHAHDQGVVHRDFKPDNCLVDESGRVRVIDFGIARQSESIDEELPLAPAGATAEIAELAKTHAGMLIGTPAYMAFEQLEGRAADARSDQFAFSVALYEALYRQAPFEGSGLLERMVEVMEGRIRATPEHTPVPEWIAPVVWRGLATQPADRHPSMEAMLDELELPEERAGSGRWIALAALAATVAVGTTLTIVSLTEPPPQPSACEGLGGDLRQVWSDARSAALTATLTGDSTRAHDSLTRVTDALDRRAAEWLAMRVDACEDTQIRREVSAATMDLRMACLDRRLAETQTAISVLEEAGPGALDHAVQLVVDLPPVARCDDLPRLEADAAHEPPPSLAERVGELRERSVRVKALARAGEFEPASTLAESLLVDAREVDWDPIVAEALLRRALTRINEGRFRDARDLLFEAAWRADRAEDARLEAEVWVTLVFVVGSKLREREMGLRFEGFARAALEQVGDDPILAGQLDYYGGLIRSALGRDEEALEVLRSAERHQRRAYEEGSWHFASTFGAQAAALTHLGRSEEGIAAYRRALAIVREALGPEHPSNAGLLNNLAIALRRAQRLDEARATLEESLALKRRVYGDEHPSVALSVCNLGSLAQRQGDFDRAAELFAEARELRARTLGESHPLYTSTLIAEADLALDRGDMPEAIAGYRHALAQHEAQGEAYRVAQTRTALANALYRAGRAREAEPLLDLALAHFEAESVEPKPAAFVQTELGAVLVELGRADEAVAPLSVAMEARSEGDVDPEDRGFTRYALGRALFESGRDRHRGWDLVQAAQRDFEQAGVPGAWAIERTQAWLQAHPRPQEQG